MRRPQPSNNSEDLLLVIELCRRLISRATQKDPSPALVLANIDVKTLLKLYPDEFPEKVCDYFEKLSAKEFEDLHIAEHKLKWRFTPFDPKEYDEYQVGKRGGNATDLHELKFKFGETLKEEFKSAVLCSGLARRKLTPYLDTLLFTCVYFYNKIWDPNGETFNGDALMLQVNRGKFLAEILHQCYRVEEPLKKYSVVVRGREISIDDEGFTNWILECIEDNILNDGLPHSMNRIAYGLKFIVDNKRRGSDRSEILNALKVLSQPHVDNNFENTQYAVKDFCLSVHKLFSFYLELSTDSFDNKRSLTYRNLLKLFNIKDYEVYQRLPSSINNKRDTASNRFGEFLRSDRYRK